MADALPDGLGAALEDVPELPEAALPAAAVVELDGGADDWEEEGWGGGFGQGLAYTYCSAAPLQAFPAEAS